MKNYIDLGRNVLGNWERYVFLDTENLLVKSLIRRHMIRLKLERVLTMDNEQYQMVAVKVLKKDEKLFLQAMEELKGKMLLFGYRDYEDHGGELLEEVRELLRKEAKQTGRISLPTGGTVRADVLPEI